MEVWAALVAQIVKNPPAMQETSLDREDTLKKSMATPTPVFLPRELHGQKSLASYSPWGHKDSDTTKGPTLPLSLHGDTVYTE